MKALVLESPGTPFVATTVPDPVPGPGEAVARVLACGSGLTIQHVRAARMRVAYPRVIGHEITGEIVALGHDCGSLRVGDPVTAYFYLTCGECRWCRADRETLCERFAGYVGRDVDGGYAEYAKLPERSFLPLPDGLDHRAHPAEIGVITDAVATPVKVIDRARVKAGETVAVVGAGGGLGVHMLMLARLAGARVIAVDRRAEKLDACRTAGADEVVDASAGDWAEGVLSLTGGLGADVVVDFVSSRATLETGIAALGRGGRLVTLGGAGEAFTAPAPELLAKEIEILGSRYATRGEVAEALDLVAAGKVWPMVTETVGLEGAEALHARIERGEVVGRAAILFD